MFASGSRQELLMWPRGSAISLLVPGEHSYHLAKLSHLRVLLMIPAPPVDESDQIGDIDSHLLGLGAHLLGGAGVFFRVGRVLLDHFIHFRHGQVHLGETLRLFARRRGDFRNQFRDFFLGFGQLGYRGHRERMPF